MDYKRKYVSKLIEEVVPNWVLDEYRMDYVYGYTLVNTPKTYEEITWEIRKIMEQILSDTFDMLLEQEESPFLIFWNHIIEKNKETDKDGKTVFQQQFARYPWHLRGNISRELEETVVNIMNTDRTKGDIYFFRYEHAADELNPIIRVIKLDKAMQDYLTSGVIHSGREATW